MAELPRGNSLLAEARRAITARHYAYACDLFRELDQYLSGPAGVVPTDWAMAQGTGPYGALSQIQMAQRLLGSALAVLEDEL